MSGFPTAYLTIYKYLVAVNNYTNMPSVIRNSIVKLLFGTIVLELEDTKRQLDQERAQRKDLQNRVLKAYRRNHELDVLIQEFIRKSKDGRKYCKIVSSKKDSLRKFVMTIDQFPSRVEGEIEIFIFDPGHYCAVGRTYARTVDNRLVIEECSAWLESDHGLGSAMITELVEAVNIYNRVASERDGVKTIQSIFYQFKEMDLVLTGANKLRGFFEKQQFTVMINEIANTGFAQKTFSVS
ncbi:hypothetical protein [Pseudochryseolinea flava]|uniref:Uncharacterized protein n=1 Tax=Pseudochryseolinea flava TaxID=2059302 RepID=A0A364XXB2_9BACT|nr:hypothetical protein [Pseudochryseolinea flava]RAV98877.1 hypothetical protein DQQ10_21485 [Pseudochryseolinea flava]